MFSLTFPLFFFHCSRTIIRFIFFTVHFDSSINTPRCFLYFLYSFWMLNRFVSIFCSFFTLSAAFFCLFCLPYSCEKTFPSTLVTFLFLARHLCLSVQFCALQKYQASFGVIFLPFHSRLFESRYIPEFHCSD